MDNPSTPGDDRQEVYALRSEICALRSENEALRSENAALYDEVAALRQVSQDAFVDELTGLHNRRWLRRHWGSLSDPGRQVSAVIQIDVDNFKQVNDRYGHKIGDRMIIHIGSALRTHCPDTVRTGGDEFVLLVSRRDDPITVSEAILAEARTPISSTEGPLSTTISVGVSRLTNAEGPISLSEAMERADGAMYRAKRMKGNQIVIA